jgi:hypothetical protein
MGAVVLGHDQSVSDWAGRQFGTLKGAIVFFNHYRHGNMEMAMVGDVVRQDILRRLARYVFGQLGCTRLTARTARSNTRARRMLPRAGFTFEGTNARWYGPERKDDALVFALFSENAKRWL